MRDTRPRWRTRWSPAACGGWWAMRVERVVGPEYDENELKMRVASIYAGRTNSEGNRK